MPSLIESYISKVFDQLALILNDEALRTYPIRFVRDASTDNACPIADEI
jgi:hypothetical protein